MLLVTFLQQVVFLQLGNLANQQQNSFFYPTNFPDINYKLYEIKITALKAVRELKIIHQKTDPEDQLPIINSFFNELTLTLMKTYHAFQEKVQG